MLCRICGTGDKKAEKIMRIAVFAAGIFSLIFGIVFNSCLEESQHNLSMLAGMFSGAGTGLLALAVFFELRDRFMSPEKKKEKEIEKNDERNVRLMEKTMSIVAVSGVITFAVLAFVLVGLGYVVPSLLVIAAIYLQLITYFIAYRVWSSRI
ncbi:MAG: hypothetical protein ACI4LA_10495 [Emergencia sp.]